MTKQLTPLDRLCRDIKFPTSDVTIVGNTAVWLKRGGVTGQKTLLRLREKAFELGFVETLSTGSSVPDGSRVGGDTVLTRDDGATLIYGQLFGVTKEKNHFWARLTP